jgi:phage replication O-like protein O
MLEVPNHTKIPNIIIDQHMAELSHAQFKVLMAICRKTIGWHKQSDYISISQIVELAGVSNKTVVGAIKQLEKKGFIVTQKTNRSTTLITINYEVTSVVSTPTSVTITPPSVVSTPVTSVVSTHTKETINKEESSIPTLEDVIEYFNGNGYTTDSARKMYDFYQASVSSNRQRYWKDSRGNTVKSWRQKAQSVWFKPENKKKGEDSWEAQGFSPVVIR